MTRSITAPCVGALAGALEGGIVFAILSNIELKEGAFLGVNDELVYVIILLGVIMGSIVGGVIGLIVARLNAGIGRGLLLGALVGLSLSIYLNLTTGYHDIKRTLAVIVIPGAASIGLIATVLTSDRKERQPSDGSHRSRRIIS